MHNRTITSREYKLILDPQKFTDRTQGITDFWNFVKPIIKAHGGKGKPDEDPEEKRKTWYVDTPDRALKGNHKTILRVRCEEDAEPSEQYKITAKVRAADRYHAASRPWVRCGPKIKFEEDITPQYIKDNDLNAFLAESHFQFDEDNPPSFASKFSLSASVKQADNPKFTSIQDAGQLFPFLKELEDPDTPIKTVNGFEAFEIYQKLSKVKFGDPDKVKLGLSFWYDNPDYRGLPLVAEFSFDFDAINEEATEQLELFPTNTIGNTNAFFHELQQHSEWFRFNGVTTKTAYAYDFSNQ